MAGFKAICNKLQPLKLKRAADQLIQAEIALLFCVYRTFPVRSAEGVHLLSCTNLVRGS